MPNWRRRSRPGWPSGGGRLARPLIALLDTDRFTELLPLGVVAGLFGEGHDTDERTGCLRPLRSERIIRVDLTAWSNSATGLLTRSLSADQQLRVLAEATEIVTELDRRRRAASSTLLPHGLDVRFASSSTPSPMRFPVRFPSISPRL